MPSPQLAKVVAEAMKFAQESGAASGVFDVDAYREALKETEYDLPKGTVVREIRTDNLQCFWVRTPGADGNRRILYMHGGGLVVGGFHSHKGIAAWLSHYSGCEVLFLEYRLAPENPYPAALEDFVSSLRYIAGNSMDEEGRGDLVVCGDSAGAGVMMAGLSKVEPEQRSRVVAAILFCPMLNWHPDRSPALKRSEFRRRMASAYSAGHDPADPAISAQFGDWSKVPPILVQAAYGDEFYPDAKAAFDLAEAAGRPALLDAWSDMPHVWQRFAPYLPEASEALARAGAFARTGFSKFQSNTTEAGGSL